MNELGELAVNRKYTDGNGEKQEDVTFIDIVCWNRLAEACAENLHKGSPAFVEGRLKQTAETRPRYQSSSSTTLFPYTAELSLLMTAAAISKYRARGVLEPTK